MIVTAVLVYITVYDITRLAMDIMHTCCVWYTTTHVMLVAQTSCCGARVITPTATTIVATTIAAKWPP